MPYRSQAAEAGIFSAMIVSLFFLAYLAGLGFSQMTDLRIVPWQGLAIAGSILSWFLCLAYCFDKWIDHGWAVEKQRRSRRYRYITFALVAALLLPVAITILTGHGQSTNKTIAALYRYRFWPAYSFFAALIWMAGKYFWLLFKPRLEGLGQMFRPINWGG